MKYILETLDRRHTGHESWQYRVQLIQEGLFMYTQERFRYFHQMRVWLTEQYGPSCERDTYKRTVQGFEEYGLFDPPWCWHIDREKEYLYIYVRDAATMSNIQLKWV